MKTAVAIWIGLLVLGITPTAPAGEGADGDGAVMLGVPAGSLVKTPEHDTIYLVDRGRLRPVEAPTYAKLWSGREAILTVASAPHALRGEPLGAGTRLVSAPGTTAVWLIDNAKTRRRVASFSTFRRLRFGLDHVESITSGSLAAFPEGPPLGLPAPTPPAPRPQEGSDPCYKGVRASVWAVRLLSGDRAGRGAALQALTALGPSVGHTVTSLVGALSSDRADLRGPAAPALAELGPVAVTPLMGALDDEDRYLARTAAHSLGRIGPAAAAAGPSLAAILADGDAGVPLRGSAAAALGGIGTGWEGSIASLAGQLYSKDLHRECVRALVAIGRPAIPAIGAALDREESRAPAFLALAEIVPDDPRVVPGLLGLLHARPWANQAAGLLGRMKNLPASARAALEAAYDENRANRPHRNLLARGGGRRLEAASVFEHEDEAARRAAAYEMRILEAARRQEAAPALAAGLLDADWRVRAVVACALWRADPFPGAADIIRPALEDGDRYVRELARETLTHLGASAVPALTEALGSPLADVRRRAALALERIAARHPEAAAALGPAREDPEPSVSAVARRAAAAASR